MRRLEQCLRTTDLNRTTYSATANGIGTIVLAINVLTTMLFHPGELLFKANTLCSGLIMHPACLGFY